jgi:hypothetical protein
MSEIKVDKDNFYVCIKPTNHKGEDALKIDVCGEDEENKYHVSESKKCHDDMVAMSNHLKCGMVTWSPKNAMGFIPSISLNKFGKAYMKLSDGKKSTGGKAPARALSIKDVLAIKI